jgi:hypothetical protein
MTSFVEDSLERTKATLGSKIPSSDHAETIQALAEKVTWLEFQREIAKINEVLEPL